MTTNAPPNGFNAPILHKIVELYKLFHQFLKIFPKIERFGIGQKCDSNLLEILELTILASQVSGTKKLIYLEETSQKLNALKILFRLIQELKILDLNKYVQLEARCQEIGKMLGGWIKSIKCR